MAKNRTIGTGVALSLGLGLLLALLCTLGSRFPMVRAQRLDGYSTYYVAPSCSGVPDPCYTTVQAAVDAADDPEDMIKVAAGTYTDIHQRAGITQVVYISKTVAIQGGYTTAFTDPPDPDANLTTLDAQRQGRVLYITGDVSPIVEGLRITGGDAAGLGGNPSGDSGGGVYVITATVTMSNNHVFSNTSDYGGGLYFDNSTNVALTGDTVVSNTVAITGSGGGLYFQNCSGPLLSDNLISGNSTVRGEGGGLYFGNSADVMLTDNTISSNKASPLPLAGGGGRGGAMLLDNSPSATFSDNAISNNRASWGGGVYFRNSPTVTLIANTISDNAADHAGGGMKHYGGVYFLASDNATLIGNTVSGNYSANLCGGTCFRNSDNVTLIGNVVISNSAGTCGWRVAEGGGLYFLGSNDAKLISNTVTDNSAVTFGGGLYIGASSTVALTDDTISRNKAAKGGGLYVASSDATLSGITVTANTVYTYYELDGDGGGLYLVNSTATLTNTVIADNQAETMGSGLYIQDSSPRLLHTTIVRNSDSEGHHHCRSIGLHTTIARTSGVYITGTTSTVALTNTILVSHTVGITVAAGNTATLTATLWGTGTWANLTDWGGAGTIITGTINIWGDPVFVDPDAGDYHIGPGSAAIDTGVIAGVTTDIDSEPRPAGPGYDIGADEYYYPALNATKQASPDPVVTGTQLTYTIRITNTGNVTLGATITDILPTQVVPTGVLTWTTVITAPGGIWSQAVPATVAMWYAGPLTNVVRVTTKEGVSGVYTYTTEAIVQHCYLPLVLRDF
jgi:uncharacterized repeat protein (TIGR01451 family)